MGRKKTKRVTIKKAFKAKLEKTFACPFCNHESCIECKLYHDTMYTIHYNFVVVIDRDRLVRLLAEYALLATKQSLTVLYDSLLSLNICSRFE